MAPLRVHSTAADHQVLGVWQLAAVCHARFTVLHRAIAEFDLLALQTVIRGLDTARLVKESYCPVYQRPRITCKVG